MIYPFIDCGGCRTCEIACSYHHLQCFNHNLSGIEILEKEDRAGYEIHLVEKCEGLERNICDGCAGLDEPACLRYCHAREELLKVINCFKAEQLAAENTCEVEA